METVIYLIRHSLKLSSKMISKFNTNQDKTILSEKIVLSVEGEKRAEALSKLEELNNLDKVYASNCVRTLETAKYILESQNLDVIIDDRFDEKRVGISNEKEHPDWFLLQYYDQDFKTVNGESQRDVRNRFESAFNEVLKNNKGKRVAIFSHGYAITYFLLKWAKLEELTDDRKYKYSFNNKVFFDGELDAPMIFKLVFDENDKLKSIEVIKR